MSFSGNLDTLIWNIFLSRPTTVVAQGATELRKLQVQYFLKLEKYETGYVPFFLTLPPPKKNLEASSVGLCLLGKKPKKMNIGILGTYVAKKFRPRKSFSCLATDLAEKNIFGWSSLT